MGKKVPGVGHHLLAVPLHPVLSPPGSTVPVGPAETGGSVAAAFCGTRASVWLSARGKVGLWVHGHSCQALGVAGRGSPQTSPGA